MREAARPAVLAAVLLVAVVAAPAGVATHATAAASDCSNTVIYDAFRFDNETVTQAANESATATAQNTEVSVEQAPGFVRVGATNPNGYCVEYHVRMNESIVSPAELGEITSNDGNVTAEWHAVRDFSREETYTEVVFTLPAGTEATFAPSKLRVKSLSWTGSAKSTGSSLWDRLPDVQIGEEEPLDQRTYTFTAENSTETITINLRNASTNQTVEEWQAMYRTSNESGWTPVGTDTEGPVFYRTVGEYRVQFVFNDPDAEVRFTANPTTFDKAQSSWDSWWSGTDYLGDAFDGLFD